MRIRQGTVARRLLAHVLAPHLAKGEEEALRRRVAIDLRRRAGASLANVSIRARVGEAKAAIVGGILAQGEVAVQLYPGTASKLPYSFTSQSVRSVKALRSAGVCHSRTLP